MGEPVRATEGLAKECLWRIFFVLKNDVPLRKCPSCNDARFPIGLGGNSSKARLVVNKLLVVYNQALGTGLPRKVVESDTSTWCGHSASFVL